MPDAREVYEHDPELYAALVRCEDREGNILSSIRALVPLGGIDVVELGAGTGRVTALLAPEVRSIRAFDAAAPMLRVAREQLARLGHANTSFEVADNRRLPAPDACAELSIAAWTYGHQTVWQPEGWQAEVEAGLREMLRVLRPGGTAIILETLGTGHETPFSPPADLGRYYQLLESSWGFSRTWLRTDYEFPSVEEGARLLRSFFGEDRARAFVATGGTIFPECTGLWSRRA